MVLNVSASMIHMTWGWEFFSNVIKININKNVQTSFTMIADAKSTVDIKIDVKIKRYAAVK